MSGENRILNLFAHACFFIGWAVGLLAFFEQCLENGNPLWSTVLGPPFLHHGYYGFVLLAFGWILYVRGNLLHKVFNRIKQRPSRD